MPDRKSRHPDNDLIDELSDGGLPAPAQGGSTRGLSHDVGTRAELKNSLRGETEPERVTGKDHPGANARKGRKATSRIKGGV